MSVEEIKKELDANEDLKKLFKILFSMKPEQREKAIPILLEFINGLKH